MRKRLVEHVGDARHVAPLLVREEHEVDAEDVARHHDGEAQAVGDDAPEHVGKDRRRSCVDECGGRHLAQTGYAAS